MGVQSPNCCKDGLDYGYRADVMLAGDGKRYLGARAWETCDQNVACSGLPWQSKIHDERVLLPENPGSVIFLAMAFDADDKGQNGKEAVRWYYRTGPASQWVPYSSFQLPSIQNPSFNIGDYYVGPIGVLSNPPDGVVHFFQFGVASYSPDAFASHSIDGTIRFLCPRFGLRMER